MVKAVDCAPPLLAATWYVTVPFPAPEAPPVTVTQLAALEAVHGHQLDAITPTDPFPPTALNACPPNASA